MILHSSANASTSLVLGYPRTCSSKESSHNQIELHRRGQVRIKFKFNERITLVESSLTAKYALVPSLDTSLTTPGRGSVRFRLVVREDV
jgi:hypothetical protein